MMLRQPKLATTVTCLSLDQLIKDNVALLLRSGALGTTALVTPASREGTYG